jgi:hypothetical protein
VDDERGRALMEDRLHLAAAESRVEPGGDGTELHGRAEAQGVVDRRGEHQRDDVAGAYAAICEGGR